MAKINVLHVIPTFKDSSITRIVEDIIEHLNPKAYNWVVAAPEDGDKKEPLEQLGAITYFYHVDETGESVGRLGAPKILSKIIDDNAIDIVHTHTPATTVLTWLGMRLSHKPVIYTKHLLTFPPDRKHGWLYTFVDRVSLYMANHLMPVSRTMGEIITEWPFIGEAKVTPIQNAIDYNYFNAPEERESCRREFGFGPEHVVFGYTGRIEPVKRLDLLLHAFATIYPKDKNARLLLAGVGGLMDELKALSAELGISDAVTWAGWRSDVPRLLAAMDVYVQSSANEGLSLSILEAMSAGKVVVATDVGGANEVIDPYKNGIIVPPEDLEKLSKAMQDILAVGDKRVEMGKSGQSLILNDFNVMRMTSSYEKLYHKYAPVSKKPQASAIS